MIRAWLFVLIVLVSCAQTPPPASSRLHISFNSYPVTADPRKSGDFTSSTLICLVFEGMTRCMPDGSVELALAEKVDISADLLTYTFHLRPSVWSDGTPVTAFDFERSWKKILNPAFPSVCAYLFYPILHAESVYKGRSTGEIGIRAIDDQTLEVVLERPTPYFLSLTAFPAFLPIPSHAEGQFELLGTSNPVSFVCNGPFCIDQIRPNSQIDLKKNLRYWNKCQVKLDEIQISIVINATTAWQMFERGELDWLGGSVAPFPPDSLQTIRDRYPVRYDPMAATTFCSFQTQHPYLKNANIRKAFSFAINREKIVHQITQMGETAGTRCIPPSLMGFRNKTLIQSFDPELAILHLEKGLRELGITVNRLNGLTLSFRSTDRQIAQAIQRQWKEVLNLDVNLELCELNSFRDRLQRRDYEIALYFWIAQYSDPINILERFQDPANMKNYPGWTNEHYRELVQKATAEKDRLERIYLVEAAEFLLIDDMPLTPIYHWSNPNLCQPWVKNMCTTPNGAVLFERSWIAKK